MADIVRQLTKEGIDAFRDYIEASRRGDNPGPTPSHLLYQSPYSESLRQNIEIEKNQFSTKHEAAIHFSKIFENFDQDEISYNGGLWSWFGLYYLDELNVRGKLNAPNNYILEVEQGQLNWKEYMYHLLATPFYIYRHHGKESKMLLTGPVGSRKELTYEIVARQQFARSKEFIKLVNRLYSNENQDTKSGAVSKGKAGNLYRLIAVFQQLELTYDIYNMPCEKMLELLPSEFNEWFDSSNS